MQTDTGYIRRHFGIICIRIHDQSEYKNNGCGKSREWLRKGGDDQPRSRQRFIYNGKFNISNNSMTGIFVRYLETLQVLSLS